MIPKEIMYPDNDQLIIQRNILDKGTNTYFDNTAVVSATLYDSLNNPVAGCIGITLTYVPGSYGDFQGMVEETFAPPVGGGYRLHIIADQGSAHGERDVLVDVQVRNQ